MMCVKESIHISIYTYTKQTMSLEEKAAAIEDEIPYYMRGRVTVDDELEDFMIMQPFQTFLLHTGTCVWNPGNHCHARVIYFCFILYVCAFHFSSSQIAFVDESSLLRFFFFAQMISASVHVNISGTSAYFTHLHIGQMNANLLQTKYREAGMFKGLLYISSRSDDHRDDNDNEDRKSARKRRQRRRRRIVKKLGASVVKGTSKLLKGTGKVIAAGGSGLIKGLAQVRAHVLCV